MEKKFTIIWRTMGAISLAFVEGVILNNLININEYCSIPFGRIIRCNVVWAVTLAFVLLISLGLVQLFLMSFNWSLKRLEHWRKTPKCGNIEITFETVNNGVILIRVHNREWRYPSAQIEAIVNIHGATPNRGVLRKFGTDWTTDFRNLKWEDTNTPAIKPISKQENKYLLFLRANKDENELYLDEWNDPALGALGFPTGFHQFQVTLLVSFGLYKEIIDIYTQILYEGKDKIKIISVKQNGRIERNE